ncbi:MAG: hypothetical protein H6607_04045 [Flavobacteriales bacterium]|nr:hypothetical protein [Flavobacteriales bacterium]
MPITPDQSKKGNLGYYENEVAANHWSVLIAKNSGIIKGKYNDIELQFQADLPNLIGFLRVFAIRELIPKKSTKEDLIYTNIFNVAATIDKTITLNILKDSFANRIIAFFLNLKKAEVEGETYWISRKKCYLTTPEQLLALHKLQLISFRANRGELLMSLKELPYSEEQTTRLTKFFDHVSETKA